MALDETAKKENIKGSIRKYFVDNIARTEGKKLTFDRSLSVPRIQGQSPADEWVSVNHGVLEPEQWSSHDLMIHCCTRKDPEGLRLAQLRDVVMGYLTNSGETDGFGRIPLRKVGTWTQVGTFLVADIDESPDLGADDETKFITLTCRLQWASKV